MVNNWQCFKRFSVSGGLQKKEKPGDVFSCSRQGPRFQFMFCLSSSPFFFLFFFWLSTCLIWEEKVSLSLPAYLVFPKWSAELHPPPRPPSSPFHSQSPLTEPSDLLQPPLLSMGATVTVARTGLYRGRVQDCKPPTTQATWGVAAG